MTIKASTTIDGLDSRSERTGTSEPINTINPTLLGDSSLDIRELNLGTHVGDILNGVGFFELPRRHTIRLRYKKGTPLIMRLGGRDNSQAEVTELILISSEDYKQRYNSDIPTPYFLINTAVLPPQEHGQGYKGVRINELIRLGRESDNYVASKLGLEKNNYISRYHLELNLLESGVIELREIGSTNGTYINYSESSIEDKDDIKKNNIQRNMEDIKKDPFLSMLWPDLSKGMRQGPVGNCYFVAALNTIKEHPEGVRLLRAMIQPDTQGYKVKFWGVDSFTIITDKDVTEMGLSKLRGSLGDNILERAYWRLRREQYNPTLLGGFNYEIKRTNQTMLVTNDRGEKVHEGGWMNDVFSDFLGDIAETKTEYIGRIHDIVTSGGKELFESLNGDELLTAATPDLSYMNKKIGNDKVLRNAVFSIYFPSNSEIYQKTKRNLERWPHNPTYVINVDDVYESIAQSITLGILQGDGPTFPISDINNRSHYFNFNHAYSIGHIDLKSGYVEVINPHDTVNQRYYIQLEVFYQYFYVLCITKINGSLSSQ